MSNWYRVDAEDIPALNRLGEEIGMPWSVMTNNKQYAWSVVLKLRRRSSVRVFRDNLLVWLSDKQLQLPLERQ